MERQELEDKISKIHDAIIRLEPFCEDVKSIKKWRDGNGIPGAKTQLYILWSLFLILGGLVVRVLAS